MGRAAKFVAVYDVSDDGERGRIAKVLEGFGVRVQRSAFECALTRGSVASLLRKLKELNPQTGFVFIYRVQARAGRVAVGKVPENPMDDSHYAFVI